MPTSTPILQPTPAPTPALGMLGTVIQSGDAICLRAYTGKYVGVRAGQVEALVTSPGDAQRFVLEAPRPTAGDIHSGDIVFLRASSTGSRITVQGSSHATVPAAIPDSVHAYWDHMGSWEALVVRKAGSSSSVKAEEDSSAMVVRDGDEVKFIGHTGNPLAVEDDVVSAHGGLPDGQQSFAIELCGDAVALASRRRRRRVRQAALEPVM